MVNSEVGLLKDRSKLKLVWCYLVMTCLAWNSQFESLNLKIFHEGLYTVRDGSEVMVVHLLVLGRVMSHECTSCQNEVRSGSVESFVNEEVFLFPTEVALNALYFRVEVTAYVSCSSVYSMQGTEPRCFIVECFTCVSDEHSRNAKSVIHDENRRCRIPCRIAASLEGITDTTAWERRCIRLLLNEQFTGKFLYHTAFAVMLYKGIMLFCSAFSKRLEPVCVMSNPILHSPLFHSCSYLVGNAAVKTGSVVDHVDQ